MENAAAYREEFTQQCVLRFRENLEKIRTCLGLLSEEAFWYRPNPASNATGHLLMHLTGNIRQYILSGLGGHPDTRRRPMEFQEPAAQERAAVEADFFQVCSEALEIIERLWPPLFLESKKVQGFDLTGMGILLHVVEHLSYHTGQIAYLTKMQTGKDLGFYREADLNQRND